MEILQNTSTSLPDTGYIFGVTIDGKITKTPGSAAAGIRDEDLPELAGALTTKKASREGFSY